jgi:hypothetical protein
MPPRYLAVFYSPLFSGAMTPPAALKEAYALLFLLCCNGYGGITEK